MFVNTTATCKHNSYTSRVYLVYVYTYYKVSYYKYDYVLHNMYYPQATVRIKTYVKLNDFSHSYRDYM